MNSGKPLDSGISTKEEVAQQLGISRAAVYGTEKRFLAKVKAAIAADPVFMQLVRDLGFSPTGGANVGGGKLSGTLNGRTCREQP